MIFLNDSNFIGYFGSKDDNLLSLNHAKYDIDRIHHFQKKLNGIVPHLQYLFFPKQTHSNTVYVVKNIEKNSLFELEADAVITQSQNVGIGIVTADCVPLLLFDSIKQVIGVIHAGWQGLSKKIITKTIQTMTHEFETRASDIKITMGPSACVCCYEVQPDLQSHFSPSVFECMPSGKLFLNFKKAVHIELMQQGIPENKIDMTHNHCTICELNFCSFRREKNQAGRQPSVAIKCAA